MTTFILFVLSVFCSSMSQYWQKRTALSLENKTSLSISGKTISLSLLLSIFFLGLSALFWLGVLSDWDVSMAYPLLSINFVVMLLLSHFVFKEAISYKQWFGVVLIVLGIIVLGGGDQWIS